MTCEPHYIHSDGPNKTTKSMLSIMRSLFWRIWWFGFC